MVHVNPRRAARVLRRVGEPMKPLTAKQLVALVESSTVDGLNPWMHGSTTISELKKRGLVERCQDSKGTVYRITEDGLEELRR